MGDKTRTLLALAEEVIRDIEDTCDCDAHVEQIKAYRERLDALTEPGLPLTTGEGNTAQGRAKYTLLTFGERGNGLVTDLARDVLALLAECGRLREQLDAARAHLDEIDAFASERRWASHERLQAIKATVERARAALGVEGPAE